MVVLLNVLIALYNSAYEDITDNAIDEYMALFSQKTMQFVRAPDENVFIAPFNLIEMIFLILPFEWWMPTKRYERLNNYVMGVIYSPLLLVTAWLETRDAHRVKYNQKRGRDDDDTLQEWEQLAGQVDFEADGWDKQVQQSCPDVSTDTTLVEIKALKKQVKELMKMVRDLADSKERGGEEIGS